jgi:hypothetical protein
LESIFNLKRLAKRLSTLKSRKVVKIKMDSISPYPNSHNFHRVEARKCLEIIKMLDDTILDAQSIIAEAHVLGHTGSDGNFSPIPYLHKIIAQQRIQQNLLHKLLVLYK